jgi:outer membrane receptor protein involved in Fe transport
MLIFRLKLLSKTIANTNDNISFIPKTKSLFMRNGFRFSAVLVTALILSLASFAQSVTVTGKVINSVTKEGVGSVSVTIKGTSEGTFTDPYGDFKLTIKQFPVTLVISSVGYDQQEVTVNSASDIVNVSLTPASSLGQEVVVSATRTPQRILESPVSIERIGAGNIRNAADPDYYSLVKNFKGVDLTTSSITFKTISTRGFNGSGNLRFNQLVDGMDNQAPGLNFAVGGIVGPTELDIDNVELLQGASSALYGSGGTNGTMLITSKNPFKYQGLSFQIKQGINRIGGGYSSPSPYYDWAMRWGKVVSKRFAFKISGQLISAMDWEAHDTRNLQRNNVFSSLKSGDRTTDPNYDGVNVFGDEASASINSVAQAVVAVATPLIIQQIAAQCGCSPTPAMIQGVLSTNPQTAPFYNGMVNNYFGGQFVSRTGYNERDLVDYHAYNLRLNGSLNYKITDKIEASLNGYWGTGTTVYTGADRYAIKNLKMGQYKAEVKGTNWFLRANTTQENSGDAYTATTAALFINNAWKDNSTWFQTYTGVYSASRAAGLSSAQSHANARATADQGRLLPGTAGFQNAFDLAKQTSINKGGAKFEDRTDLYHFEGQYNFSTIKVVDWLVGASYRIYHLNSHGTIFADTTGPINISEAGIYTQLQKSFLNDVLKLTGSLRYDKNKNFDGKVTPRATALIRIFPNNNIRVSYQTAYRFPSTQDQYINLLTGGANRLIGGLPQFNTFFKFNTNPAYTAESVVAYRNSIAAGAANPTLLKQAQFQVIKPETANSYEVGYRGLLTKKLLADAYVYYSQYKDFIGRTAVGRGKSGNPASAPIDLASPFTTDNYSFVVNTTDNVNAIGWALSFNYAVGKGYELSANVSSDQLHNVPSNVVTFFNTPKYRYNIGFGNGDLGKGVGFNLQWRWQDKVYWEGTFGTGEVPSFGTLDAQLSYKLPKIKGMIKFGGSNFLNHYYRSAFGNPDVGAIYYVSFGYNVLQ